MRVLMRLASPFIDPVVYRLYECIMVYGYPVSRVLSHSLGKDALTDISAIYAAQAHHPREGRRRHHGGSPEFSISA
jgi:cyanate lyase